MIEKDSLVQGTDFKGNGRDSPFLLGGKWIALDASRSIIKSVVLL